MMKNRCAILVLCFFSAVAVSSPGEAGEEEGQGRFQFSLSGCFSSAVAGAAAGSGRWYDNVAGRLSLGTRLGRWDILFSPEVARFGQPSLGKAVTNSVFNLGLGLSIRYFDNQMRTCFSSGPSVLLTDSFFNAKGTYGFFVNIEPAGFRIKVKRLVVELFPVSVSFVMPVMENMPLLYLHYMTTLGIWFDFFKTGS